MNPLGRGSDPRSSVSTRLRAERGTGSTVLRDKGRAVERLHL